MDGSGHQVRENDPRCLPCCPLLYYTSDQERPKEIKHDKREKGLRASSIQEEDYPSPDCILVQLYSSGWLQTEMWHRHVFVKNVDASKGTTRSTWGRVSFNYKMVEIVFT